MKNSKKRYTIYSLLIMIFFLVIFLIIFPFLYDKIKADKIKEKSRNEFGPNLSLYSDWSECVFENADGKAITLKEYNKKGNKSEEVTILVYWASWCPHCVNGLDQIVVLEEAAIQNNAKLILVNKLDGEKETKESALEYLEKKGITTDNIFDTDTSVYKEMGMHMIPTTLVLNAKMQLTSFVEGEVMTSKQLKVLVNEARIGKEQSLFQTLQNTMMLPNGAMKTTYEEKNELATGKDVLSESQGYLMEYAVLTENQELFEQTYQYVIDHLFVEGLMPWVVSTQQEVTSNASIDDLRIMKALLRANEKWGNYQKDIESYEKAIYAYNIEDNKLVDLYDISSKQKATRLTLCFADFEAMEQLRSIRKDWKQIYHNSLKLVKQGMISESFPLYYAYYDYEKGCYRVDDDLNMSEALTTLLNLAKVGELPEESMDWLTQKIEEGCLYARYNKDGTPSKDGFFESTAVYALAAMIADEMGRDEVSRAAVTLMEKQKVKEADSDFLFCFGEANGQGLYSFDQLNALFVYQLMERTDKRMSN